MPPLIQPVLPAPDRIPFLQGMDPQNADALPTLAPANSMGAAPMPTLSAPSLPQVETYGQHDRALRQSYDEGQLAKLDAPHLGQEGSSHPGMFGKVLHVLGQAGGIALTALNPNIAALTPGTQLHNGILRGNLNQDLAQITQEGQAEQQGIDADQQAQAQTAYTQQRPAIEQAKMLLKQQTTDSQNQQKAAAKGQLYKRNDDGTVSIDDDPNSEIFQRNQIKEQLLDAQVKSTGAQEDLRNAQAAYDQAKVDPTSPLFKQVAQRLAIAQQNANAAVTRAQAYMGNYLQHTKNVDLSGNTLAGAPVISDSQGGQTVVGSTNAGAAIKQNSAVGSFNDLSGSVDHTESALRSFFAEGGSLTDPAVISALNDKHSMTAQFIGGLVQSGLSPKAIAAVTAIRQNHEQAGILRKATGGTASEAGSQRILDTTPMPGDSNDVALSKIQEQKNVRDRLAPGITAVSGGVDVAGKAPTLKTARTVPQPSGNTQPSSDQIPPSAAAQLQEGFVHTFGNGQQWTKKAGKPVRVK